MSQLLPIAARNGSPNFRMGIALDFGVPYLFDFRWNKRDSAWYFDIYEADETVIGLGIKVVLGTYLGRRIQHSLFKSGVFIAFDLSRKSIEPTLDDFGTRVQIRRYLAQEIAMNNQGFTV